MLYIMDIKAIVVIYYSENNFIIAVFEAFKELT